MTASVYCRALPTGLACVPEPAAGATDPGRIPAGPPSRGPRPAPLRTRPEAGHDQLHARSASDADRDSPDPAAHRPHNTWAAVANQAAALVNAHVNGTVHANGVVEVTSSPKGRHPRPKSTTATATTASCGRYSPVTTEA